MLDALPIHPSLLHPLTGEPLRALWIRPDGRACWPIIGGDGTDDDANDDKPDDDTDSGDEDDSNAEGDDSDDQDDDKVDWKAKFEAEQRHKRNLERKARKDAATIGRLTGKKPAGGSKDDEEPDPEKIREEARAEARREALSERVADKIEAKAAAFADPEDAVAVLLRSRDIEDFIDDDKVDVEAIADALKELGEKKPHLLAQGGKKFQGDGDGGARKGGQGRPKNLADAVGRHYQKR